MIENGLCNFRNGRTAVSRARACAVIVTLSEIALTAARISFSNSFRPKLVAAAAAVYLIIIRARCNM